MSVISRLWRGAAATVVALMLAVLLPSTAQATAPNSVTLDPVVLQSDTGLGLLATFHVSCLRGRWFGVTARLRVAGRLVTDYVGSSDLNCAGLDQPVRAPVWIPTTTIPAGSAVSISFSADSCVDGGEDYCLFYFGWRTQPVSLQPTSERVDEPASLHDFGATMSAHVNPRAVLHADGTVTGSVTYTCSAQWDFFEFYGFSGSLTQTAGYADTYNPVRQGCPKQDLTRPFRMSSTGGHLRPGPALLRVGMDAGLGPRAGGPNANAFRIVDLISAP